MLVLLIIVVIISWGLWGFAEKKALEYGTPWQTLFVSLFWKTIFSLPLITLLLYINENLQGFFINKLVWFWMLISVIFNGVAIVLIRFVLLKKGAGIVIALTSVYPVITALLALVFLRETLSLIQWAGIGITTLGVVLLEKS
jgi:transporter family protein